MNENDFSPRQSLQLIESMINRAKDKYAEDGFMYLLWGWLVFILSIIQFVLLHVFNYAYHYIVWLVTIPVFIYQIFYTKKKNRNQKVFTYTDAIIGYVWITYAIVMLLLCFFIGILTSGEYFKYIIHILLAVYGMPVFLTGIIIKYRPLIYGGIACWVLCILSTFIKNYDYQFLCIPAAMIVAWIIPGYSLRAKYKSQ
ncbi:hypothetical protein [Parafilimonas sp.]|uniref:hypothetical protein n=1 Tax=Parafilimonas sp. TaxID=1969739 RepID=UPI0039E6A1F7